MVWPREVNLSFCYLWLLGIHIFLDSDQVSNLFIPFFIVVWNASTDRGEAMDGYRFPFSFNICMFFSSLICDITMHVWVTRTLFALIFSSTAMSFNSLIYGNLYHMALCSSIFALLVDYMQCMVFTYFIIGLKSRDWSIIRVALGC